MTVPPVLGFVSILQLTSEGGEDSEGCFVNFLNV